MSELIAFFADEYLAKFAGMHYRWNFPEANTEFLMNEWDRVMYPSIHVHGSLEAKRETLEWSRKASSAFSSTLPMLGVNDETIPAIEDQFLHLLLSLNEHLTAHQYIMGSRPCLADFALIGPLYAHLYRDPASGLLMKSKAPRVAEYVEALVFEVFPLNNVKVTETEGKFAFTEVKPPYEFIGNDVIPESLFPIIQMFLNDNFPMLEQTVDLLREYRKSCDLKKEIPRVIGMVDGTVNGVACSKAAFAFDVWKLQNLLKVLERASAEKRTEVTALLEAFGEKGREFDKFSMNDVQVFKETNKKCKGSTLYFAPAIKL